MIIFERDFLLKKINKKSFARNIRNWINDKRSERIWQFHTLKPASVSLSSNLQDKPFLNNQKSIKNVILNILSLLGIVKRGGGIFYIFNNVIQVTIICLVLGESVKQRIVP